ncbi:hypothetical protein [Caudoviricetes sp.]|nr:hypothetical protein [Caudoviricetes sp.]
MHGHYSCRCKSSGIEGSLSPRVRHKNRSSR